jgi:hypothetical protein
MSTGNRAGRQARPVDWSEWAHAREVKLIEAVALSLGIDPHQMRLHPHGWMATPGAVIADEGDEFDKRLRMAGRALGNELDVVAPVMGSPASSGVVIAQFAGWARDVVRWNVPSELAALAVSQAGESTQAASGTNAPEPLTTGDMAALLAGIERTEKQWRKMLASCPKWAGGARVSSGAPGKASALWGPVALALALESRGAPRSKLNAIFRHPLASHWLNEWEKAKAGAGEYGL